MSDPNIQPMPEWVRKTPERLRPMPPPVFADIEPSEADRTLARELFNLLDPESQAWYGATFNQFKQSRSKPTRTTTKKRNTK